MKVAFPFFVFVMVITACVLGTLHYKNNSSELKRVYTQASLEESLKAEEVVKSDIADLLQKAEIEYVANKKSNTINLLKKAIYYIRNQQSNEIKSLLPNEVEGWEKRADVSKESEVAPFGQALAYKEFVNGDKLIKISVILGSDLNDEIYKLAMQADGAGGVGDYNGYITKFYRSPQNNRLIIAVGKDAVVTIDGFQLSHSGGLKIADSLNLGEILNYTNK